MEQREFKGYNCDLSSLQESIELYFAGKGLRVTNFRMDDVYLTQVYNRDMPNRNLNIRITGTSMSFKVMIGMGTRIDNIRNQQPSFEETSFSDRIILGSLRIEGDFWDFLATKVELMKNTFEPRRATALDSPQIYSGHEIVREIEVVYCSHCGTKNNARAISCSYCNATLH